MGVRLRNEFNSIDAIAWKIDVIDEDYAAAVLTFETESPGFQLKYAAGDEPWDPIHASQAKVFGLVEDSDLEDLIDDLADSGEDRFFVKIYKDASLYWTGKMLIDQASKQDRYYPYAFDMTFTDGVGALKDIDFDNSGTLYTGREDITGIILKILDKTGIADQFGANDDFLKTCVHWYDAHHPDPFYAKWCPLKYTDIDHMAFYDYENEENKPKKCWEILEDILVTFGCVLKQADGLFQIIQPNELINETIMTRTFDKSGTFNSYAYFEQYMVNSGSYDKLAGGMTRYLPPLQYVQRKYLYKQSPEGTNIIPEQDKYETAVDFITDVSGGNDEYLMFASALHIILELSQVQEPFKIKWRMDIVITKSDASKRYLYNGPNGTDAYSWSTNSNHYVTIWSMIGMNQRTYYNIFQGINFNTNELPWDATGTFRFRFVNFYTEKGDEVFHIQGSSDMEYICDFHLLLIYENQVAPEGTLIFKATNDNTGEYSKALDLPDSHIGDGPNLYSLGRLETSDGSTTINSTLWGFKDGARDTKIHQLLVNETISRRQQPVDVFSASYVSSAYSAEKCFLVGAAVYIPMNITLSAKDDIWQGQWWKLKLSGYTPETGLWIEPAVYEAGYVWNLKNWSTQNLVEDEEDVPNDVDNRVGMPSSATNDLMAQVQTLTDILKIAQLNENISTGDAKAAITVDLMDTQVLQAGDVIRIVGRGGGYFEELVVSSDQAPGATSISVVSNTFENDFQLGCKVIMSIYKLIGKIGRYWIQDDGKWRDAGRWDDSDKWKDT